MEERFSMWNETVMSGQLTEFAANRLVAWVALSQVKQHWTVQPARAGQS